MFCPNCGKVLPDNARFCAVCGTPVKEPEKKPNIIVDTFVPVTERTGGIRLDALKNRSLFFFGSLATTLLALFFLLGKQIKAQVSFLGYSESQNASMFEDLAFWKVVFILVYLGAIAAALLPLLLDGKWKLWNQIPVAGAAAVTVLWMLVVLIILKVEINNYGFGSAAKVGLSFSGVVLLLLNFGTIALSVLSFLQDLKSGMKFV